MREKRDQSLVRHARLDAPARLGAEREHGQLWPVFCQYGDRVVAKRNITRRIEYELVYVGKGEQGLERGEGDFLRCDVALPLVGGGQ